MSIFNKQTNELQPYVVSSRSINSEEDWLVLDWNESTYKIDNYLKESLVKFIKNGELNLYGDVDCTRLKADLRISLGIDESCITFFNGSDSALNICFESILNQGDEVLTIEPEYSQVSTFIHMKGGVKTSFLLHAIDKPSISELNKSLKGKKIFYFSNPNNPIGFSFSIKEIEIMITSNPSVVFFVDEAYYEFSNCSAVDLVSKFANLIIFRTFSKAFGLAGIRLGYIISNKYNIEVINKIRNGKEVSSIAQLAASCILENYSLVQQRVNELIITRNLFFEKFNNLSNYEVFPSSANFLLLRHVKSKEIIFALNQSKILVRDRSSMHLLNNCFRVTIGTKDEMERVLNVLKQY